MDWQERVNELLFAGESVRERVAVGEGTILVTTHRLLAFTPERTDKQYWQVDLPNVREIEPAFRTSRGLRRMATKTLTVGLVLLGAGLFVELPMITPGSTGGAGTEIGVFDAVEIGVSLLARLTELMLQVGSGLCLLAVVFGGLYWHRRVPTLVVHTAGNDPNIVVSRPAEDEAIERLRTAVFDNPQPAKKRRIE